MRQTISAVQLKNLVKIFKTSDSNPKIGVVYSSRNKKSQMVNLNRMFIIFNLD